MKTNYKYTFKSKNIANIYIIAFAVLQRNVCIYNICHSWSDIQPLMNILIKHIYEMLLLTVRLLYYVLQRIYYTGCQ